MDTGVLYEDGDPKGGSAAGTGGTKKLQEEAFPTSVPYAWQNLVITAAALLIVFILAWRRGFSPLEMVSAPADRALVETLRRRFASRSHRDRAA